MEESAGTGHDADLDQERRATLGFGAGGWFARRSLVGRVGFAGVGSVGDGCQLEVIPLLEIESGQLRLLAGTGRDDTDFLLEVVTLIVVLGFLEIPVIAQIRIRFSRFPQPAPEIYSGQDNHCGNDQQQANGVSIHIHL